MAARAPSETGPRGPPTVKIARMLDVDDNHLRRFVARHPEPEPEHVLAFANASGQHRARVAAWLRDYTQRVTRRRAQQRRGGDQQ